MRTTKQVCVVMLTIYKNWGVRLDLRRCCRCDCDRGQAPLHEPMTQKRRTCTWRSTSGLQRTRSWRPRRTSSTRRETSEITRRTHQDGIAIDPVLIDHANDGDIGEAVDMNRASSNGNIHADDSGVTGVWIFQSLMLPLF